MKIVKTVRGYRDEDSAFIVSSEMVDRLLAHHQAYVDFLRAAQKFRDNEELISYALPLWGIYNGVDHPKEEDWNRLAPSVRERWLATVRAARELLT